MGLPYKERSSLYWNRAQSFYSLRGKTSYHNIFWSLEAVTLRFKIFQSLWYLIGSLAALLSKWYREVLACNLAILPSDILSLVNKWLKLSLHRCHMHVRAPANWLFVQRYVLADNKENTDVLYYQPFVRGIHQWLVNSLHSGHLTHLSLVLHICISELGQHGFR